MKLLQGTLQPIGYRLSRLVDPEDLDLLRFEDTGELPEGVDFAVLWEGDWREGRCYDSWPGRTFVTYGDALRLPLHPGMQTRRPNYILELEDLLELARAYAHELGYSMTQPLTIVGESTSIEAGESTEVALATEHEHPALIITISLFSRGDIRLLVSN